MPLVDAQWIERRLGVARTTKQQERLADGEFLCCRPTYVGRMILLCGRKDALFPFQCLVGPDWPCMLVTYSIVTVPTVFFFVLVASQVGWVAFLLGLVTFSLTIVCFSLTACSDPGIVYRRIVDEEAGNGNGPHVVGTTNGTLASTDPAAAAATLPLVQGEAETGAAAANQRSGTLPEAANSSTGLVVAAVPPPTAVSAVVQRSSRSGAPVDPSARIPCSRCELSRPMGASHCYDCEVCVEGLDHHCPWTGKCIGQKNLCFFYAFLISLTVHILYVGVVTGMNAITTGFKVHDSE